MKIIFFCIFAVILATGCSTQSCRQMQSQNSLELKTSKDSAMKKIKVFKFDGTIQCEKNKGTPLDVMKKELKDIPVYSSTHQHDGLMRPQMCGMPTGYCNVYEIDEDQLDKALSLGFKKWIALN